MQIRIRRSTILLIAAVFVLFLCMLLLAYLHRETDYLIPFRQDPANDFQCDEVKTSDILEIAKRIGKHSRQILVNFINDPYLPLTFNWLCNTKDFDVHKSVLIVTIGQLSCARIRRDWPGINVVLVRMPSSHDDQSYSTVGYVKMMIKRTEMIQTMLQTGLDVVQFESDFVWFSNPIPYLGSLKDVDMVMNRVSARDEFNGGLFYLHNTKRTTALYTKLKQMMDELGESISNDLENKEVSQKHNDQQYMTSLIKSRYADIRVETLPLDRYPDGLFWNALPQIVRREMRPILIHNNFIVGNSAKVTRAKKWGHWFLNDDTTCNTERVKKVVY